MGSERDGRQEGFEHIKCSGCPSPFRKLLAHPVSFYYVQDVLTQFERREFVEKGLLCSFFVCCNFTFWKHLKSYHEMYRLVTVRTHGNFIVLPHNIYYMGTTGHGSRIGREWFSCAGDRGFKPMVESNQ